MNEAKIIHKYSNGLQLSKKELAFLEDRLMILINEALLSDARPAIADEDICDALGLRKESFQMSCLAAILDKLSPITDGICRDQKVFHVLLQSKFLYY
tara:strand:+ start:391 stop:684 length:294 start_codon:yes stop_codon:yes gene_type:complete